MSMQRGIVAVLGPTVGGVLVVTLGAGWAVAIDGITYLRGRRDPGCWSRSRRRCRKEERTSMVADLREGWRYFPSTTWLWVVVLAFGLLNALHSGAILTLGPLLAKRRRSARPAGGWACRRRPRGCCCTTPGDAQGPARAPAALGDGRVARSSACRCSALGLAPARRTLVVAFFVAGVGIEVFGLGWNLAMQEHVPDEMLSRAYSYDSLGSFIAIPIGQLAPVPLAHPVRHPGDDPRPRDHLRRGLPGHAGVALGARPPAGRPRVTGSRT